MKTHGLCAAERIKSRKQIDRLYAEGTPSFSTQSDEATPRRGRLFVFPFAVCWMECGEADAPCGARLLVSVSKRRLKHAVDRNRAKRLMRECYRQTKPQLYAALASHNKHLLIAISYSYNQLLEYHQLQPRYAKLLQKLIKEIENANPPSQCQKS